MINGTWAFLKVWCTLVSVLTSCCAWILEDAIYWEWLDDALTILTRHYPSPRSVGGSHCTVSFVCFWFVVLFMNSTFFSLLRFWVGGWLAGYVKHVEMAVLWMVVAILYACAEGWGPFFIKGMLSGWLGDQPYPSDARSQLCNGLDLHGDVCQPICGQVNTVLTWTAVY